MKIKMKNLTSSKTNSGDVVFFLFATISKEINGNIVSLNNDYVFEFYNDSDLYNIDLNDFDDYNNCIKPKLLEKLMQNKKEIDQLFEQQLNNGQ